MGRINTKSIHFGTTIHLLLFAVILMLLLWVLQIVFMNTFYQSMKENQAKNVVAEVEAAYQEMDMADFLKEVELIGEKNEIHLFLAAADGTLLSSSKTMFPHEEDKREIEMINQELADSKTGKVSVYITDSHIDKQKLGYGVVLSESGKEPLMFYAISMLHPMESTSRILTTQLLYITIISLCISVALAIYMSTRITTPIRKITASANKLAEGQFGVTFEGGKYTELTDLADTLTKASIGLERSVNMQRDLIANVSHDLKTPLTMVKSYAEMIRDLSGDNPEKRDHHLQVIIDEADRLNRLVGDLLTISKLQSGALEIKQCDFDMNDTVASMIESYSVLADEGYVFSFETCGQLMVNGDTERIKQVLANLISNAVKFCGDDKFIGVELSVEGANAVCRVTDHGPGIEPEILEHIWERYYQSSANKSRSTTGTGLGLSIVKEILSLHKVKYGVDSALGEGSTFWFELPICK